MSEHDFWYDDVVVIVKGAGKGLIGVVDDEDAHGLVVYPGGMLNRVGLNPYLVKRPSSLRPATPEELEAFRAQQRDLHAAWRADAAVAASNAGAKAQH